MVPKVSRLIKAAMKAIIWVTAQVLQSILATTVAFLGSSGRRSNRAFRIVINSDNEEVIITADLHRRKLRNFITRTCTVTRK